MYLRLRIITLICLSSLVVIIVNCSSFSDQNMTSYSVASIPGHSKEEHFSFEQPGIEVTYSAEDNIEYSGISLERILPFFN